MSVGAALGVAPGVTVKTQVPPEVIGPQAEGVIVVPEGKAGETV